MSNPNPPSVAAPSPRWVRWIGVAALALFAAFLARHTVVVAGGSDSSGYLNSARLFAAGRLVTPLRVPADFPRPSRDEIMHYCPQGFYPGRHQHELLTPTYPTGLPLQYALAGRLLGWNAGPWFVVLGSAVAAVGLCYLLGRELGLPASLASAGAVMLGAFPVFLFTSIQPLSDTPATTWTLATLLAALRSRRRDGPGGRWWAAAAGSAFAIAVLVRPTSLLLAPALVLLVGWNWRRLAAFVAGGLPGAAWLAYYNHTLYGHALTSGYGEIFGAFGWAYGAPTALHFLRWLALLLPAAVLVLPFAALVRGGWRSAPLTALLLAFAAITGCYLYYEVSHEVWWCLRFILPVVPCLILAALLGVESLARRWPGRGRRGAVALLLGAWAIGGSWYWTRTLAVFMVPHYERAYVEGVDLVRPRVPANALILSLAFSGTLQFYTDLPVLRWDQMQPEHFARYTQLARQAGRPIFALLFNVEQEDAFRRCPGPWRKVADVTNVGLWQLEAPPATPR